MGLTQPSAQSLFISSDNASAVVDGWRRHEQALDRHLVWRHCLAAGDAHAMLPSAQQQHLMLGCEHEGSTCRAMRCWPCAGQLHAPASILALCLAMHTAANGRRYSIQYMLLLHSSCQHCCCCRHSSPEGAWPLQQPALWSNLSGGPAPPARGRAMLIRFCCKTVGSVSLGASAAQSQRFTQWLPQWRSSLLTGASAG